MLSRTRSVPWDSTPLYLQASDLTPLPGVLPSYAYLRRNGSTPEDVTSYHPGQHNWSPENLPDVMYLLTSPNAREALRSAAKPEPMRDSNGNKIQERWPEPGSIAPRVVLQFSVLPDRIGTAEYWWVIESWRRLDPRISWEDIIMRMSTPRPGMNTLNMRGKRGRTNFNMLSWHGTSPNHTWIATVEAKLSQEQIDANTTRGLTPGLINPVAGEAGGRIINDYNPTVEDRRPLSSLATMVKDEANKEMDTLNGPRRSDRTHNLPPRYAIDTKDESHTPVKRSREVTPSSILFDETAPKKRRGRPRKHDKALDSTHTLTTEHTPLQPCHYGIPPLEEQLGSTPNSSPRPAKRGFVSQATFAELLPLPQAGPQLASYVPQTFGSFQPAPSRRVYDPDFQLKTDRNGPIFGSVQSNLFQRAQGSYALASNAQYEQQRAVSPHPQSTAAQYGQQCVYSPHPQSTAAQYGRHHANSPFSAPALAQYGHQSAPAKFPVYRRSSAYGSLLAQHRQLEQPQAQVYRGSHPVFTGLQPVSRTGSRPTEILHRVHSIPPLRNRDYPDLENATGQPIILQASPQRSHDPYFHENIKFESEIVPILEPDDFDDVESVNDYIGDAIILRSTTPVVATPIDYDEAANNIH